MIILDTLAVYRISVHMKIFGNSVFFIYFHQDRQSCYPIYMQFKAGHFKLENREMIFQWGDNQLCASANQLCRQESKETKKLVSHLFEHFGR